MMPELGLRTRAFLSEHFDVVVVVLAGVLLVTGWFAATAYAMPGTHTEERPVASWETTGAFTHQATVVRENQVFPVGSTLSNRSVYFDRIAPTLEGAHRFRYDATGTGSLAVDSTLSLVVASRAPEENVTYWRTTRELDAVHVDAVEPGEPVTVPFSVNVSAVENRTTEIKRQLGDPGETSVRLAVSTRLDGSVNDRRVNRTLAYTLPITLDGSTYRVADPGEVTDEYQQTRTVAVPNTYGPLRRAGAPLAFFGAGALLGVVLFVGGLTPWGDDRLTLTSVERERLAYRDDRSDFDEWITTVRLPETARSLPRAEAASLGDLVDYAIDTDNAVVEDPVDGHYYVVDEGYLYTYTPPASTGPDLAERDDQSAEAPPRMD